jgi:hypothetical protein
VEQDIAALALSAATTLVQAMTTDAWGRAKTSVLSLWRRICPAQADTVEGELDAARLELLAGEDARGNQLVPGLEAEWAARLRDLVAVEREAAALLLDLASALTRFCEESQAAPRVSVEMRAKASGHGRVFQAGRDQRITER